MLISFFAALVIVLVSNIHSRAFELGSIELREGTYQGKFSYLPKEANKKKRFEKTSSVFVISDISIVGYAFLDNSDFPFAFSNLEQINRIKSFNPCKGFDEFNQRFSAISSSKLKVLLTDNGKVVGKGIAKHIKKDDTSKQSKFQGSYIFNDGKIYKILSIASDGSIIILSTSTSEAICTVGGYGTIDNDGNMEINISIPESSFTRTAKLTKINESQYELTTESSSSSTIFTKI